MLSRLIGCVRIGIISVRTHSGYHLLLLHSAFNWLSNVALAGVADDCNHLESFVRKNCLSGNSDCSFPSSTLNGNYLGKESFSERLFEYYGLNRRRKEPRAGGEPAGVMEPLIGVDS